MSYEAKEIMKKFGEKVRFFESLKALILFPNCIKNLFPALT